MELPLANRELVQAARAKATYATRSALAGVALLVLSVTVLMVQSFSLIITPGMGTTGEGEAERLGRVLAGLAFGTQGLVLWLIAPLLTAGLVAQEKREGTLGLLLMADLSGRDIYVAKFLRAFIQVELLLLSTLPFVAIAAFMGGVAVPEAVQALLTGSIDAAAVCAVGILCSTLTTRPATALFATLLLTGLWLGGRSLFGLALSTAVGIPLPFAALDPEPVVQIAVAVAVGIVASLLAIRLLPRQAVAREGGRARRARGGLGRRLFPVEPAEHFVTTGSAGLMGSVRGTGVRILILIGIGALAFFIPCVGMLIVVGLMCYDLATTMEAARSDGALEEVVLTPLENRVLARAFFRANLRQAGLYIGGVMVADVLFSALTFTAVSGPGIFSLGQFASGTGLLPGIGLGLGIVIAQLLNAAASGVAMTAAVALLTFVAVHKGSALRHARVTLALFVLLMVVVSVPSQATGVMVSVFPTASGPVGASTGPGTMVFLYSVLRPVVQGIMEIALYGGAAILAYCALVREINSALRRYEPIPHGVVATSP